MEIYVINYLEDFVNFYNGTLFVLLRGYTGSRENVNKSLRHDIKFPIILLSYPCWVAGEKQGRRREDRIDAGKTFGKLHCTPYHIIYTACMQFTIMNGKNSFFSYRTAEYGVCINKI